ncbi:MAG TPA: AAA family ATPase [Thermoleophilaceae bacterium]
MTDEPRPAHLTDGDWRDLRQSGLSVETILAAQLRSYTAAEASDFLGYGVSGALFIPYPTIANGNGSRPFGRVKLHDAGPDGKKGYRTRKGDGNHLYRPPLPALEQLADVTVPIFWTEGEKKSLKAAQEGLCCLALAGVWNFLQHPDGDKRAPSIPLAEFDAIPLHGRTCYIVFDSDLVTNESVRAAERALAAELGRRGADVWAVRLPSGDGGAKVGLDDYLVAHSVEAFCALQPVSLDPRRDYIQTIGEFLAEPDPPQDSVFPDLLPTDTLMVIHGDPRARKSLVGFELALSAATGTAPFGLECFKPAEPIPVLYVQEEDHRTPTKTRLARLVRERCGEALPNERLHVIVRRGVSLDDPEDVAWLTAQIRARGVRFVVLDAMRRLSEKADEGPSIVRELVAVLRGIVTATHVTLAIVHHDVKPLAIGQDQRRRAHRASGADWFAASECPVHVERLSDTDSLVFPQDYKFSLDPQPFTFTCLYDGRLITALKGTLSTPEQAESAGPKGRVLAWFKTNGPANKTTLRKAGFSWRELPGILDSLIKDGTIDATPGKTPRSVLYFVRSSQNPTPGDDQTAS